MIKTFCKEFVKTTIYSAVSTVVTIGTIAMIGIVKEKIENSKENK